MSRPWTGSKGSWERKPQISREEVHNNFDNIFGKRFNWLQRKKIMESWNA